MDHPITPCPFTVRASGANERSRESVGGLFGRCGYYDLAREWRPPVTAAHHELVTNWPSERMSYSSSIIRKARRIAGSAYRSIAPVFANPGRSSWLPLDSRVIGPPRRWSHTPEYCAKRGFEWREVEPARHVERRPPRCTNYPAPEMLKHVASRFSASGTARLRNARVVGPHGWIVGEGDTYLPDHSWYGDAIAECPIYKKDSLTPTVRLNGVTLSLCTDWPTNYGHLVFDAFSRIHLFEQAGYTWDDVSYVLIPELSSPGKLAMAERCGIPLNKCVTLRSDAIVECEELIAPTFPGARRNTPRWVADFWRARAPLARQKGRRLFISRRGFARSVSNEEELAPVLAEFGFETVVSSDENIIGHLYPDAEIVMGPHGAALADILFCRPGSALIELIPPGHVFPYYYTIADSVGMEYFSILGRYPTNDVGDTTTAHFMVSPEELRYAILSAESLLASGAPAPL